MIAPKTLILFVHGFLGSESSFGNFPLDLVQSIRQQYKVRNLEARLFPFFSTKGDPNKSVNMLYNWLLLNAAEPEYEAVIIIGHSMGGLIAADAIRKLWQNKRNQHEPLLLRTKSFSLATAEVEIKELRTKTSKEDLSKELQDLKENVDQNSKKGWFSWGGKSEQIPVATVGDVLQSIPVEDNGKSRPDNVELNSFNSSGNVNVIGLISFDSPFFGLSSNVFTVAASEEIADFVTGFVPFEQVIL
jgi:hypothetical protein